MYGVLRITNKYYVFPEYSLGRILKNEKSKLRLKGGRKQMIFCMKEKFN